MPGCISEGDTLAGALRNLAEAVELWQDEPYPDVEAHQKNHESHE